MPSPIALGERKAMRRRSRRNLAAATAFLAPFLILLALFQYVPLGFMLRDSFFDYTLINPDDETFVGLKNLLAVFTDPTTLQSLLVTLLFMVGVVLMTVPLSFLLGVYLNTKLPARPLVRTMIFLPVITSSVVVATLWTFLLNQNGLVNSAARAIGLSAQPFLTSEHQALPAIIVMTVWQQVGLGAVLYLGGLQSIPGELVEAARMDGANAIQRLIHLIIPLMSRTTLLVVVVTTVFALQSFAPAYIMTQGAPEGSTNTLVYQIYKMAFNLQQPGFASAISLVLLIIAITIALVQNRLLRTRWDYS